MLKTVVPQKTVLLRYLCRIYNQITVYTPKQYNFNSNTIIIESNQTIYINIIMLCYGNKININLND